ncbi:MAG: hypothetical protein ABFD07_20170 [Methanobacterium sp.]
MKCEQGDMAKIIYSIRPTNVGKIVLVDEYIGHFKQGETFSFRGIPCKALVTDHYWWISSEYGLTNMLGDTPKAYIPDTWLEPIRPETLKEKSTEEIDVVA